MPLAEEAKRSLFAYMGEVQCSRLFFLEIIFDNAQEVFGVGKDICSLFSRNLFFVVIVPYVPCSEGVTKHLWYLLGIT